MPREGETMTAKGSVILRVKALRDALPGLSLRAAKCIVDADSDQELILVVRAVVAERRADALMAELDRRRDAELQEARDA